MVSQPYTSLNVFIIEGGHAEPPITLRLRLVRELFNFFAEANKACQMVGTPSAIDT